VREALSAAGVPEGAEPAVGQIEAQLAALGPAPRRIARSPAELQVCLLKTMMDFTVVCRQRIRPRSAYNARALPTGGWLLVVGG
jgi:hypothetical protein